jgi:3-mercaptopropionate dioxygenase
VSAPVSYSIPALDRWVDTVRSAVDTGGDAGATAFAVRAAVARLLGDTNAVGALVRALQAEAREHPARVLAQHAEPDEPFTVQAFRWPPGWTTSIHDHVAWGVVAVLVGAEHERLFRRDGEWVRPRGRRVTSAGECSVFVPPHDIHQVSTPQPALALHVYGADLSATGSSTRRRYEEGPPDPR